MQNSRFLRGVIVMQKSYNETLSALYRKLYDNEFIVDNDESNNGFDLEKLSISLPSPANLNMTNLSDQLSTVSGVIDFIVQTVVGQNNGDNEQSDVIRRIVTEKFITNIDWREIDDLIKNNKQVEIGNTLLKGKGQEEDHSDY